MTGTFFSSGAVRKCSSIACPPASIASKWSAPIMQLDGQADGAPERVAPADPVPEGEHVLGVDAELASPPRWPWTRRRSASAPPASLPELLDEPRAGAARVHQRLLRRERLALDDEERLLGVERPSASRRGACRRRSRRSAARISGCQYGSSAPRRHHRAEVAAADADVDDVGDALARVALPRAAAHRVA